MKDKKRRRALGHHLLTQTADSGADTGARVGDDAGVSTDLTGHLLISNASLFDPNFRRTVVLVGHHYEDGAVGVV